jgi:hypothetical protein
MHNMPALIKLRYVSLSSVTVALAHSGGTFNGVPVKIHST